MQFRVGGLVIGRVHGRSIVQMSTHARPYDLVLFGATGFAGKLAGEYALRHHPGCRLALAGRDRAKLEATRAALLEAAPAGAVEPAILLADAMVESECRALAGQTEVLASTAGPYAKYGSAMFGACAAEGTDYCDLTGEAAWVERMAFEHHSAAVASGATLVPAAGFDSVPSDIGTLLAVRQYEAAHGEAPLRVDNYVTSMTGGFQGGTIETVIHGMDHPEPRPVKPKSETKTTIDWAHARLRSVELDGASLYTSPFIMASANAPVVRRSNEALRYRDGFVYSETLALDSRWAAVANAATLAAGGAALAFGPTRQLVRGRLPAAGQGPSRGKMQRGEYCMKFVATGDAGKRTQLTWTAKGDPSCTQTTIFLVETALGLLERRKKGGEPTGVLTPAAALGTNLWDRLETATWDTDSVRAITLERN